MKITYEQTGLKDLRDNLKRVSTEAKGKIMRGTMTKAAKIHVLKAKSTLASKSWNTGRLHEAINTRSFVGTKARPFAAVAGLQSRRSRGYKGFHWHLVEFGTSERKWENGKSTGAMKAEPFIRPAFRNSANQSVELIRKTMARRIKAAIKRKEKGL